MFGFGGFEIALWLLLAIASITDLIWGKVYNWTTFAFFFGGLSCRFLFEGGDAGLESLQAIGLAMLLFMPLYVLSVVAAGDVKLLMAFAAWTNSTTVLRIALLGVLIGAAVGVLNLLQARGLRKSARSIWKHARAQTADEELFHMAFAPAFLVAYLVLHVAIFRGWELWV